MNTFDFEDAYMDNTVVGYHKDKVIVKRDDGELFFCEIPENLISLGETILPKDLTSISTLSLDEQKEIRNKYEKSEV